ncbi:hypothetical protein [Actinomadura physcomitrii]|nr:hypothetical protein [Actinomadura physcomitrii]
MTGVDMCPRALGALVLRDPAAAASQPARAAAMPVAVLLDGVPA